MDDCNSYWNLDHVLRIPCGEVIYVSILISGLTTWYVHLFSFNTCSIIHTWRSSANIGRLWFASPGCPSSYINATDVPTNLRSQGFYGITPRYFRKGMIRRFVNTWKIFLSTICRTYFSNFIYHYSRLTWLKGCRVGFADAQTLSTTRNKSRQCMSIIHSLIYVRGWR